ncbi:DUF1540 domain-containing protein [Bacillus sp. FJAT-53060]|uniref:DUF1540 domain-containing protein n=1 Tax=Bacillus TaxID=1386 RepID=UPI001CFB0B67|nr:DUF1540 domain-containing protein [Bacillus stratosphericus]
MAQNVLCEVNSCRFGLKTTVTASTIKINKSTMTDVTRNAETDCETFETKNTRFSR